MVDMSSGIAAAPPTLPASFLGTIHLRPGQQQAVGYHAGRMGIAAVPGSGKTFTLEMLVCKLIVVDGADPARMGLFTYMRSSRANMTKRINQRLSQNGVSGRIEAMTLHSLALRILREFQGRLGWDHLDILEGYEQDRLMTRLSQGWLQANPHYWEKLLPATNSPTTASKQRRRFMREFRSMCRSVVRTAKSYCLSPERITAKEHEFLGWALPVYRHYQRELTRLGKVDYDDLGWKALDLMQRDPEVLAEVQNWYDFIFEDESQDSSPLQEELLTLISARHGNLVRVGDPNQSIMSTFTTADPYYFRQFCQSNPQVTLAESSRSAPKILTLANALVDWVQDYHPLPELRQSLSRQHIRPAGQGNPTDAEAEITFLPITGSPDAELRAVADLAAQSYRERPNSSIVILTPTNDTGSQVLMALKNKELPVVDLLRNNPTQKEGILRLKQVVEFLALPTHGPRLQAAFQVAAQAVRMDPSEIAFHSAWITQVPPERLLFPLWGSPIPWPTHLSPQQCVQVKPILATLSDWLRYAHAPWADVLRLLVQRLQRNTTDLFLGNYLVDQLERVLGERPTADWQTVADEIQPIWENGLNNMPVELTDYNPMPGTIAVTTVHRSKGLEWDEVLITGLSAYEYPVEPQERPQGIQFLDGVNMEAEALAQLRQQTQAPHAGDRPPTEQAFLDVAAERLRLLYVGITRAKRRLTLTVSTQNRFEKDQEPSQVFSVLSQTIA
ncbi:MAG: ATP-dependent helicase [Synechococcales cyanobacterium]